MCWVLRQAFTLQTSKAIKVFDENGDEFSNRLDQLCHQNGWDQNAHPILITQDEDEGCEDLNKDDFMTDHFEKNVILRYFINFHVVAFNDKPLG